MTFLDLILFLILAVAIGYFAVQMVLADRKFYQRERFTIRNIRYHLLSDD